MQPSRCLPSGTVRFNPPIRFIQDRQLVSVLSRVAVGRSSKWRSTTEATISVRGGVSVVLPGIATVHAVGAARTAILAGVVALVETVDQASKLLLHDQYALLDDGVRLQVTRALDLEVELVWNSPVVERLTWLARLLESSVLALWPVFMLISSCRSLQP